MKRKYEGPFAEIQEFDLKDIIMGTTTSGSDNTGVGGSSGTDDITDGPDDEDDE